MDEIYTSETLKEFNCLDCNQNTSGISEYYMVHDHLWAKCVPEDRGMLCIGCLENRLGRKLVGADFTKALINDGTFMNHSRRLRSRISS